MTFAFFSCDSLSSCSSSLSSSSLSSMPPHLSPASGSVPPAKQSTWLGQSQRRLAWSSTWSWSYLPSSFSSTPSSWWKWATLPWALPPLPAAVMVLKALKNAFFYFIKTSSPLQALCSGTSSRPSFTWHWRPPLFSSPFSFWYCSCQRGFLMLPSVSLNLPLFNPFSSLSGGTSASTASPSSSRSPWTTCRRSLAETAAAPTAAAVAEAAMAVATTAAAAAAPTAATARTPRRRRRPPMRPLPAFWAVEVEAVEVVQEEEAEALVVAVVVAAVVVVVLEEQQEEVVTSFLDTSP